MQLRLPVYLRVRRQTPAHARSHAGSQINLRRIKLAVRRNKEPWRAREGNFIFLHPGRRLTASFITELTFRPRYLRAGRVSDAEPRFVQLSARQPYANYQFPPSSSALAARGMFHGAPICRQEMFVDYTESPATYRVMHRRGNALLSPELKRQLSEAALYPDMNTTNRLYVQLRIATLIYQRYQFICRIDR